MNNCTIITDLTIEKKLIESLLKEKDDNNCSLIIENYKVERLYKIKEIKSQLNELMDEKMKKINYS